MTIQPKRVAILGFDCAVPKLLEKHIEEGALPNFKKAIEQGVFAENCLGVYPTITPPNWTTIATGTYPGTHGVTDFWLNQPDLTPNDLNTRQAYDSEKVQAEFIWDALDKAGKKCVVMNYPVSWPSHMKNGVVVGGTGLTIGDDRNGLWNLEFKDRLGMDKLLTTGDYPAATKGEFKPADGWSDISDFGSDPIEFKAEITGFKAKVEPELTTWYVLAAKSGGNRYNRIALCPGKDLNKAFCTLTVGEWSSKIFTHIKIQTGEKWEVYFRCKLIALSPDASDFRLYMTAFTPLEPAYLESICSDPELMAQLERSLSDNAVMPSVGGIPGIASGWYDFDTYIETVELHDQWLSQAADFLLRDKDWDLFCMHSHPIDWGYHIYMNKLDPQATPDDAEREKYWDIHRKVYQAQDKLLGRLMEILGEDTLVAIVSDHGATPDGPIFSPHDPLRQAGLTAYADETVQSMGAEFGRFGDQYPWFGLEPDASKSKAIPNRMSNIYVNLKGRFPEGIVEPEDYAIVQQEIIDVLYQYVDPKSGKRPVSLALSKQDARIIGLHGDNVGDVIYAVYADFGVCQHGPHLPTASFGVGELASLLTFTGPGVIKGVRLDRTIRLTDVVPTLCYIMDWTVPEQTEGAVIYQAIPK